MFWLCKYYNWWFCHWQVLHQHGDNHLATGWSPPKSRKCRAEEKVFAKRIYPVGNPIKLLPLQAGQFWNQEPSQKLWSHHPKHQAYASRIFSRLRKVCFLWPRFCCWPPPSPVWQSNLDLSPAKKWAKPVKTFELSDVESWLNPPNEAHLTKVRHKKSTATPQGNTRAILWCWVLSQQKSQCLKMHSSSTPPNTRPWQPFPSRSHHWAPAEVQEPISGGIIKLGAQVFVGCLQNLCTSLHSNGHVKCIYLSTKNLGWACFDVTKSDTMWYAPLEPCDRHIEIEWSREFIFLVAAHLPTTSCHLRSSFCVTAHCSTHFCLSNLFSSWKTTIGTLPWAMRFTVERSSEMSKWGFWSMALCEVSFRKVGSKIPKDPGDPDSFDIHLHCWVLWTPAICWKTSQQDAAGVPVHVLREGPCHRHAESSLVFTYISPSLLDLNMDKPREQIQANSHQLLLGNTIPKALLCHSHLPSTKTRLSTGTMI